LGSVSISFSPFGLVLDYIILPDSLYIKQKNFDVFLQFFLPPEFIKNYLSEWIKIDYKKLNELNKNKTLLFKKSNQSLLRAQISNDELLKELEEIGRIIIKSKILIIKKEGSEFINGIKTDKFYVSLQKEKIIPTLREINEVLPSDIKIKENEFKDLEEILNKNEKMPVIYYYINPSNELLYRISYNDEIKAKNLESPVKVHFEINFSNHNKEFEINPPQNYVELEKILEELNKFNFVQQLQQPSVPMLPFSTSSSPLDNSLPLTTSSPLFEF